MVLAEDVTARDDLPPFRASVMVCMTSFLIDSLLLRMAMRSVLEIIKTKKGLAGTKAADL